MAITKCLHMKQAKTGYPAKHLANGLRYIMNPEKTEHGRYVCGHNCIPEQALSQMVDTKRHFGKLDKRQGYHFILSFEEDEVSEEEAFQVVGEFVTEFLGKDFEAVYAVHNDTDHIHGHIIFNSVRCTTGYKYDYKNRDWENIIQPLTNRICKEHGLSVLDLEKVKEKRKQKGQEETSLSERDRRIKEIWTRHYRTQVLMRNFLKIFPTWDMSCGGENVFPFGNPEQEGQGGWTS